MADEKVRFGLIGFGAWGQLHAASISKTQGAALVAIAAKSEATRAKAKDTYPDASVHADYRELVQRDDIDVIDVVLPSHLHHEVGLAALTSGKHLLMEKPMCLTLAHCDELIRTARAHETLLAVGHELRLSSLWCKVKTMIDDGFIGVPQYVLVELSRRPYRPGAEGWRFDIERVGNWILEEPIHFFDLARWYLGGTGEPTSVFATANSRQPDHPELQDNFSAIVNFSGGGYAVVTQTLSAFEHHQMVKITGTQGALWAGWSGAMDRTLHPTFFLKAFDGENVEEIRIDKITGEVFELEDQMEMLVRAVRHGEPLAATGEDGRWSVAMCHAAARSVGLGQPVKLSEVC